MIDTNNLWRFEAMFHNRWLNFLKRETGASFVAYVRYKDNYEIRVKGVGDETFFIEVPNPQEITEEDYRDMVKQINDYGTDM